jgi:RHS repeat-associated protein
LLSSRNTRKDATDPGTTIGFTYDARGYLLTRQQYLSGQGETFTHDEMGRLTKWESTAGTGNWKVEYGYDSIGNLQSREESLNGTSQGIKTFASGYTDNCKNQAGPHSVTTVTSNGTTQCYGYDARGQQTSGGDQRAVAYTAYGLPATITRNGVGWQFGYDATHRRATKTGPGGSTTYVGSLYEKRVNSDGTEAHVMYVLAGGEVKAQIVVDGTGGGETIDYLMHDHLGSVTETRANGTWQDTRFDPYGSRISATPPPTFDSDAPSSRVRLGFTGQEEDDDLGLVNMNGRIYDPAIARFLTPDPLVSMHSPSQSWNRYSYANNSPLRFIDPSGFDPQDGSGNNGLPPGVHMECTSLWVCGYMTSSGIYLTQDNWKWVTGQSYSTSGVGANVGSFDEAGAGTSSAAAGITAGMVAGSKQGESQGGDGTSGALDEVLGPGTDSAGRGELAKLTGDKIACFDNCNRIYEIERMPEYQRGMNNAFVLTVASLGGAVATELAIQAEIWLGTLTLAPPAILQSAPTLYNLGRDLASAEASSVFSAEGGLSAEAIASSRMIIPSYQLRNPAIDDGFSKFATQTYLSPSGPFQVHFYMNANGIVNTYLDFKVVFNNGIIPWNLGQAR